MRACTRRKRQLGPVGGEKKKLDDDGAVRSTPRHFPTQKGQAAAFSKGSREEDGLKPCVTSDISSFRGFAAFDSACTRRISWKHMVLI